MNGSDGHGPRRGDLAALLQLSSPALPVGAYAYSQGLECAIDEGRVASEAQAQGWIGDQLRLVIGRYEAPVWLRLVRACVAGDRDGFADWNARFIASRESRESRAETLQMGYSLVQLLGGLGHAMPAGGDEIAWPAAHAWACVRWGIEPGAGLIGYLYSWLENQVGAAIRAVPLGQLAGQRILYALRADLAAVAAQAGQLGDEALSTQAPMLGIVSSRHEQQYSRLFRS